MYLLECSLPKRSPYSSYNVLNWSTLFTDIRLRNNLSSSRETTQHAYYAFTFKKIPAVYSLKSVGIHYRLRHGNRPRVALISQYSIYIRRNEILTFNYDYKLSTNCTEFLFVFVFNPMKCADSCTIMRLRSSVS